MNTFVGRERELGRLQAFFDAAAVGQAQVCFVAGEAGAGKTALVSEFLRRAQERDERLLAAVGQCNAQTGAGDAYLPFREALAELTGLADDRAAPSPGAPNAGRLADLLVRSAHVLVEFGPDLIGTVVPGSLLLAKFGKAVAQKAGLLDELDRLVQRKGTAGGPAELEQSRIFEQYARVLAALAQEQPLVLILDDLHWADRASLGLLFHLSRNLAGSRVLIVGTYRPDDVALGREGQRHPLEPILNEIKRYRGDVVIDLGATQAAEGRAFVDALIDSEPNRLGEDFRQALFEHTDGHPLFTVETLRNLQERGDLLKDAEGHWVQSPALDWAALPARVEGVIAERIGRLAPEQRETLDVGSVVGADFAAQVVARVRQRQEGELIRQLSRELGQRHRLVQEEGETRVGRQFLSQYRFAHALFQQYVYAELGAGERRVLHGDVAAALEALYADQAGAVAVQLARHYAEAGDDEKAAEYALQAGDAAARGYAFAEARAFYAQALEALKRLPDTVENRRRRVDTTIQYVTFAWTSDNPAANLARLGEVEPLARDLPGDGTPGGDPLRRARVHHHRARYYFLQNAMPEALAEFEQSLPVARQFGDQELIAAPSEVLGLFMFTSGQFPQTQEHLTAATAALEALSQWPDWVVATQVLGAALSARGQYAQGGEYLRQALARAEALKSVDLVAGTNSSLALHYVFGGEWQRALQAANTAITLAEKGGARYAQLSGFSGRFWVETALGDWRAAEVSNTRWRELAAALGGRVTLPDLVEALHARIALLAGDIDAALARAEQAVAAARAANGLWGVWLGERVWGEALARCSPPRWDEAEAHLAESLRACEEGDARLEAARTRVAWGRVAQARGNMDIAREHLNLAATQFEASGLEWELDAVRTLLAAATGASAHPESIHKP